MFRTARLPLLRRALFLTTLQHTRRWSSSQGPDGQDPTNKKQQPTTEVPAKNSGSSSSGEKAATPPPPPKVEGKAPDTKSPTTNAQQTNTGGHNNNNSSSEKNENIDDTFANDASIPKGFEAFYSKVLLSKMPLKKPPSESIARALTMSPSERALVMEIAKRERRKKTWRNLGIVSCLLMALVAYRTYQARTRLDADISNYTVVMVDLPSHTAVYLDEHHKILGARNFVDYHKFEQTCDPAKDIIISYSTYYPWVPMLLLCLLPVLALMHTGFNGSAKMAAAMVQSEKARFNFQREMNVATRLKDVAGLTEAKREVVEVVDFLKQPERYQALGAKLPKGVLLDGPPGVGKTLLAKAVAGEAMVPFVSCSGSEFEEVYVGVGAQRVRELFREAHKCKPCVVFIDEIDAFGRKRKSDGNGSSRGTLNAFLSELDGFKDSSGIMVLAATNRSDILDNALTRSGRFDRKISLENPSYKDRIAIAAVHLAPLRLDPNTSLTNFAEMLAALTPGCSGADIFNICNESAIQAAREAKDFVSQPHFHIAVERVLVGLEKSAVKYTPIERERLAYHEAGVVVLNWFQKETDPVIKTTILPRGRHRTGVTQKLPQNTYISTEARLLEKIVGRLGGYVAEERFFNDVSSSAADDLQSATNMAREMVCTYGMDPEHIGHLGYDLNQSDAIQKPFGPDKEDSIDHSVEEIVQSCLKRARAILQDHLQHTRIVAGLLVRQETLTAQELWYHLGDRPVMSKEFQTYLES